MDTAHIKPIEEVDLRFVESFEDVQEFFRWLSQDRQFLAFDCETGGLNYWDDGLRLVQFGDCNTGWVFRSDRWLGVVEEVFKKYTGNFVGQNVYFDVRFIEHDSKGIKIPTGKLFDTKVMGHILDPTRSTSLKAMGARFLSPTAKALQNSLAAAMKKQGWTWKTVPIDFDIYWGYAAMDTILTSRIAAEFWSAIEHEYMRVFELEMGASKVCSEMEVRGTTIDLRYCNEKYDEILKFTAESERWCIENYGIRPGQNQEVALALVKDGVDLSKTTATGDFAMDKDVLEGITHPLAETVLAHRKATKIGSTYFSNFLSMNENGVVHPSINTLGARTGRMSVQNPAVQTLPRGRVVRDAFITRPGNVWLSVDYDQIEMRLLAHFAQDKNLIDAINSGDVHTETARKVFNDPNLEKKDPRRSLAKNAGFAKIYGAGIEKFAWTAGVSVEDAVMFLDSYDTQFPGVKGFMRTVESVAKQRLASDGVGFVKSPIGRRHTAEKDKLYTLCNYLIQGTAAEAFKQALVDLDNAGYGQYMLIPCHDEQNFELPAEHAEDLQHDITEIMTQTQWAVPLTVDSSIASSWGEAK